MALIQWKQIDPRLRGDGQLTGSLYLSGSQSVTGDLNVGGILTAQEYHSELISASVLYESGSSLFGNSADDTHLFTGSVNITGSLFVNGEDVSSTSYNGDRIVSNTLLPELFNASFNPGTSGSIVEFLNAVFYPNSAPEITTGANITTAEYTLSGSTLATLSATDPESQSLTWALENSYIADLVKLSTNGVLTLNTKASASFNTVDRGDGTLAHSIPVKVEDTFGDSDTRTFYLHVTPNEAPAFRETSVGGSIINSFTTARNENASTGEITKIYFTDVESDTVTIRSSSIAGDHFSITKYSNYVSIAQVTSSLDFETTSSYTFSITASDEHYENGDDLDSVTTLPITINVTDNVIPTFNDQTLTGFSEDENDGDSSKQLAATDPEGDTKVFTTFTLAGLELDGTPVSIGTYTGASQSDPNEDPFQMNSSGVVTRKSSQYINSDLINTYIYSASVSDAFNTTSASAAITITIADDVAATVTNNSPFYIIESALDGASITTNTSGIAGTVADFNANQSVTFTVEPSSTFSIASNGNLSVNEDISGSYFSPNTLSGVVTASNSFGTETYSAFTVTVTDNSAPNINPQAETLNLNTNGAAANALLYTLTFSDPDGDDMDFDSFEFTGSDGLGWYRSGDTIFVTASTDLDAGNYNFTASIYDEYGEDQQVNPVAFSIAQAPAGELTTNGTFYIIESATSGSLIRTNSNGRTGTQGDLGVSYSPNYNSAAVQSFTSSNAAIAVGQFGALSVALDISGSTTGSGDTITSVITFRDQYDNIGSGNITVNVAANQAPTATFTNHSSLYETLYALDGVTLVSMSISDTEEDTPFSASLGGSNASSFTLIPTNANSSSYGIAANGDLDAGTYNFDVTASDSFSKSTSYSRSITIAQSADYGTLYVYSLSGNRVLGLGGNFNGTVGISTTNTGTTPDTVTTTLASSPFGEFQSGSLGDATISVGAGTLNRRLAVTASADTSSIDAILRAEGSFSTAGTQEQIYILAPSGSDMTGVPTSIAESFGGSTADEYVLNVNTDNAGWTNTIEGANIYNLPMESSHLGYTNYIVIARTSTNTGASSFELRLTPSSGSAPTT